MKRIKFTQGQFAIVDDKDFERLSQWKWYAWLNTSNQSYYAIRSVKRINGKQSVIRMAREILGLEKGDKDKETIGIIRHLTIVGVI